MVGQIAPQRQKKKAFDFSKPLFSLVAGAGFVRDIASQCLFLRVHELKLTGVLRPPFTWREPTYS